MSHEPTGSRRLTGPNLFLPEFGAVLEAPLADRHDETLIAAWQEAARALWKELGWEAPQTAVRHYPGFATLAASAPEDVLYTACEANETAWARAVAASGGTPPAHNPAERLAELSAEERSPRRRAMAAAARRHGVRFLADDEWVSVGSGRGSMVWPVGEVPNPEAIDWGQVSDIPVALITGTNGKTSTVRMLAAMATQDGRVAGNTSTDGVQLDGQVIAAGDYTGGEGARLLLRDRRVEIALLEVARGGMLRRGLPVETAEVAYVSNVGTDHLGEYGIDSLNGLAEVKMLVARAVEYAGTLVINGDDLRLRTELPTDRVVRVHVDPDTIPPCPAFVRQRGRLGRADEGAFHAWIEAAAIPATLGGAAVHNVYNALGAMAVATSLGIGRAAIIDALGAFRSDATTNPGRCNVFDLNGMRAIVDYAHNPEGLELVLRMALALRPTRTAVLIGQAGDRTNASIAALARTCAAHAPELVVVKQMDKYGRGRDAAEVAARLAADLIAAGHPADRLERAPGEMEGVRRLLDWGQPGDLLLLLSHAERPAVLGLMNQLHEQGWRPGSPLPPSPNEPPV